MCHVLVIEDEWLLAEYISEIVSEAGATSIETTDNQDGAVAAASVHKPDVIVSDVRLVSGTGPRAVQAIHAAYGAIPVIFITSSPDECKPCAPPGIVLGKPINERLVANAFRRIAPR